MKVGITGGEGFVGWHLRCYLKTLEVVEEVRSVGRETFSDQNLVDEFVVGLDCIVHLAGVNRAEPDELIDGNTSPATQLVKALINKGESPCIIYSSSTYAEVGDTDYGQGKAEAGSILNSWAEKNKARFVNMVIPHVFGEYGKPLYNSAMATFCHLITKGEELKVNKGGKLELIHVQDLVEQFVTVYKDGLEGSVRVSGYEISVEEAAKRLQSLHDEYVNTNQLPDLSDHMDRSMFNALRGSFETKSRVRSPVKHTDDRGWLVETVRAGSGGQCFVSTTKPGITRGNHFHRRKVERFFVLQGKADIKLRKLFTDEVINYTLDGSQPSYVDIPTLHTHSITNVGTEELITLFWSDEFFDPDNSDTYFENVELTEQ